MYSLISMKWFHLHEQTLNSTKPPSWYLFHYRHNIFKYKSFPNCKTETPILFITFQIITSNP